MLPLFFNTLVLRLSAFVSLVLISAIFTANEQAYAQQNIRGQALLRGDLESKFSRAVLTRPSAFQEPNHFFVQSAIRDSIKGKIQLRSKFLGSQKFIYGGSEPQKVYGFWGITFRSEFQETMSIHPIALKEAKKAYPYNALRLAGTVGLVGLSVKSLFDSINKAQKVSGGELVDDGLNVSDVVLVCLAGSVTVISGALSKHHLENGVRVFNNRQK